jgi:tetratricopeptide (TPR) repeat protein
MGRGSSEKQSLAEMLGLFCLANVDLREGKLDSVEARLAGMDSIRKSIPAVTDSSNTLKMIAAVDLDGSRLLRAELLIARGRPADVPAVVPQHARKRILPSVGFQNGPGWCGGSDGEATHIPITADYLARAYAAMGLPDSAIALYERGFSTKPAHELYPPYHYRLALLYEQKDMNEKAITEYEKFLNLGKGGPDLQGAGGCEKEVGEVETGKVVASRRRRDELSMIHG